MASLRKSERLISSRATDVLPSVRRSYPPQLPAAATRRSYPPQLPAAATRRSYPPQLPAAATRRSYPPQLPAAATRRSYPPQLPAAATKFPSHGSGRPGLELWTATKLSSAGFEPTAVLTFGLRVRRLNHSATRSLVHIYIYIHIINKKY